MKLIHHLIRCFSHHYLCWWCDMPLPDCVCPVSRLKAANDNVLGKSFGAYGAGPPKAATDFCNCL